jgi:hypothetical protein
MGIGWMRPTPCICLAQMVLTKHDDMVKTVPPDRTDCLSQYPFCYGDRNRPIPNAHGPDALDEFIAIGLVSIT